MDVCANIVGEVRQNEIWKITEIEINFFNFIFAHIDEHQIFIVAKVVGS